ncbi:phosphotransferase enzyme family protein [Tumebacillus flagellatus]|uniref:Aminoglycoside phosphotransferase domain-containing protein n=1 Tax=Tumebacillus flagellatus TaxID=1157490 RepID=A0A074LRE6_9BACL|nr:phosphotransferase [Tumebacillus flagellatus]KEO83649.1 hypothetical protein EL26_08290 [Tumebacillus flagellatus]
MMMTLAGMVRFFAATGEAGPDAEMVPQLLERWGYDAGTIRFVRASQNVILKFQRDGQDFILRLSHESERSLQEIEAELAFLNFLAQRDVPVHQPVASKAGREIETCDSSLGVFHAVVFTYLHGEHPELEDLDETGFARWGAAMGRLHQVASQYEAECERLPRDADTDQAKTGRRKTCFEQLALAKAALPAEETAALQEVTRLETWLRSLPRTDDNFGMIHFDFELDNLIRREDGELQILDFDGCSCNWFAADIAFALRDLYVAGAEADEEDPRIRAFLQGYRTKKTLLPADAAHLPMFLRFHQLLMFAKLLDVVRLESGPEWAMNLKARLEGKLQALRECFSQRGASK